MKLTDDIFKQFRTFLKANGLYKDFMECFRSQTYYNGRFTATFPREAIPNYISVMKNYNNHASSYAEYGAMVLTFASFNWCNDIETKPPLEFTRRWCTVGAKWGLYCRANNIEICDDEELSRLIRYWNEDKSWIDPYMLSYEELDVLKYDFAVTNIAGINIDSLMI